MDRDVSFRPLLAFLLVSPDNMFAEKLSRDSWSRQRRSRRSVARSHAEQLECRALLTTFDVSNLADSGDGSLRAAIENANSNPGLDTIEFSIATDNQAYEIELLSPLPTITESVEIDGWSAPGFVDQPIIVLNGAAAGNDATGLVVDGHNVLIRGLVIQNFSGHGIHLGTAISSVIKGNYIGTDSTGNLPAGNGGHGIFVSTDSERHTIGTDADEDMDELEGNVISANDGDGVHIHGSEESTIAGNFIGTTVGGIGGLGNSGNGIQFVESQVNFVGGTADYAGNVIGANAANGIYINNSFDQVIQNNRIGISTEDTNLGNQLDGIRLVGGGLQGNPPFIIYVIDVSGSTETEFDGTGVGDVNDDGSADTILDAELAGFIEFTDNLIGLGFGNVVEVGISVFASDYSQLDVSPEDDIQYSTRIGSDADGNGEFDIIENLKLITSGYNGVGSGTSFANGLNAAIATIEDPDTPDDGLNLIFVSDGEDGGDDFTSQINTLDQLGVSRTAIGMGESASLPDLQLIDGDAERVTSSTEFSDLLLNLLGLSNRPDGTFGTNVTIGGDGANEGNIIAYNAQDGVNAANSLAVDNAIRANSIFANVDLGIDIGLSGHEENDLFDIDFGANYLMNYPVISGTEYNAELDVIQVTGEFSSAAEQEFLIDVYANRSINDAGYSQGEIYLHTFRVTTDASGLVGFDEQVPSLPEGIYYVTMTATDLNGNTSEFSQGSEILVPPGTFFIHDAEASEADEEIVFTVTLDKPLAYEVILDITPTEMTAKADQDFDASVQSVTYAAGEFGDKFVTIPLLQDSQSELRETFQVSLSSQSEFGELLPGMDDTAIGTIEDEDTAIFVMDDFTVNEDDLSVDVEISYTNPLDIPVIVDVNLVDITTNGATDFDTTSISVSFLPSVEQTKSFSFALVRDEIVEATESFEIQLTTDSELGLRSINLRDISTVTIVDNDSTEIAISEASADEDSTTLTAGVTLEYPLDIESVYAVDFTGLEATANVDFSSTIPNVTIPAGETQGTITISLLDDEITEREERIELSLTPVTDPGDRSVSFSSGIAAIIDNDVAVFAIDDFTVNEVDGSFDFDITLDRIIDTAVELEISFLVDEDPIANSATFGVDYSAAANPISFFWPEASTETNTFSVQLLDDGLAEGLEEFSIVLNTTTDLEARTVFLGDRGRITIEDDDLRLVLTETDGFTETTETGERDTFYLSLGGEPLSTVTVDLDNTNPGEVRVLTSRLIFTPENWNVPQAVIVEGQQDELPDGPLSGDVIAEINDGLSDSAFHNLEALTIPIINRDDDLPEWEVIETGTSTVVYENGSTDSVFLQLSRPPVSLAVFEVSAADESRITVEPQTIVFSPDNWRTPRRIVFVGVDDNENNTDTMTDIVVTPTAASDELFLLMPDLRIPVEIRAEHNFTLDVDGDGAAQALTDGILVLRYMAGFRGDSLIASAVNPEGTRTTAAEIEPWLAERIDFLDADADGQQQPLTDGILWIRLAAGFSGDSLVRNAVGAGARTTAAEVGDYMRPFLEPPVAAMAMPGVISAAQNGETQDSSAVFFSGVGRDEQSLDEFFSNELYGL